MYTSFSESMTGVPEVGGSADAYREWSCESPPKASASRLERLPPLYGYGIGEKSRTGKRSLFTGG